MPVPPRGRGIVKIQEQDLLCLTSPDPLESQLAHLLPSLTVAEVTGRFPNLFRWLTSDLGDLCLEIPFMRFDSVCVVQPWVPVVWAFHEDPSCFIFSPVGSTSIHRPGSEPVSAESASKYFRLLQTRRSLLQSTQFGCGSRRVAIHGT